MSSAAFKTGNYDKIVSKAPYLPSFFKLNLAYTGGIEERLHTCWES